MTDSTPVRLARTLALTMCFVAVVVLGYDVAVMLTVDQPKTVPTVVDGSREAGTA